MGARNIKLTLEYDGERYHGWQRQPGEKTVQGVVEAALTKIIREQVRLTGAGRTDAGVHARGQVANFETKSSIPLRNLRLALNSDLPEDIAIKRLVRAPAKFHTRYGAVSKLYRYTILNAPAPSPLARKQVYYFPLLLDLQAMKKGAKFLRGKHDFSSFRGSGGKKGNCVRNLKQLKVSRRGDFIYLDLEADGFLYNMARIIAGTLLWVGKGKLTPVAVEEIIKAKDRRRAGPTLPGRGLCLVKVKYR